jgi:hypothetical protein
MKRTGGYGANMLPGSETASIIKKKKTKETVNPIGQPRMIPLDLIFAGAQNYNSVVSGGPGTTPVVDTSMLQSDSLFSTMKELNLIID